MWDIPLALFLCISIVSKHCWLLYWFCTKHKAYEGTILLKRLLPRIRLRLQACPALRLACWRVARRSGSLNHVFIHRTEPA
uniref:Putative secreted protein n=1 Tax=Ixodes ricinus TaxID=34613 RepID=A0A6B0U1S0_IXORI